jgi:LytS/YehU family sensor histidine kinase
LRHAFFQAENAEVAEQDKTLAELELLKTQIHPHFLFNTLESLYSHTQQNSGRSPEIILTLSDLLRFMIYESKAEFIPLTQEIQLIKNYVELEKFRYGDDVDISLNFSGELEGKFIRPLLLLPLLENSFKHGTGNELDQKWISLDLNVDSGQIYFNLSNSRNPEKNENGMTGEPKGVSLENVKRRIELYYPGKHTFMIKEDGDIFLVRLELRLENKQPGKGITWYTEKEKYDLEMPAG